MKALEDQSVPNILTSFAHLLGTTVANNRLQIPGKFGNGYCAGFVFNEHIRMLISDYELKEDLLVERPCERAAGSTLFFKFQHVFPKTAAADAKTLSTQIPSVLIATSRINTDEVFAIHSNTETVNIEVTTGYLSQLLNYSERSPVLQSLLSNSPPLLFEQLIYPSVQKVINEILTEAVNGTFKLFFLRIKAEELICRLLMELDKREEKQLYPLNDHDVKVIYKLRDQILSRLEIPPIIDDMAVNAGMSPTKLKRLFRQIFGYSIFNYYQQFRMKEAARLLKEERLSVSAVGYRLGFTNLSHFTRVFRQHNGMKPKQYSRS